MQFPVFDIISVIVLIVLGVRAMQKGFIKEFLGKASFIVGFLAALMFAGMAAEYLHQWIDIGEWTNVLSFVLLFLAGFAATRLFSISFSRVMKQMRLSKLDSFFGFVLGVLEGALVVSFIVFLLRLQTYFDVALILERSWFAQMLEPIAPYSIDLVTGGM